MPGAEGPGVDLSAAIDHKAYGDRPVLKDVRFTAASGEVIALLAPSGTGKTTTLGIIMGLERGFAGAVRRPPGPLGAVFQEPLLLPWLDVRGNLQLVAPSITDGAVAKLLDMARLPGAQSLHPKQLSLGMARRVALARALAVRPALLVLDEPFASLDPQLADGLARDVVSHARRTGCLVLMATHDLDQAFAIADRLLILGGQSPATLVADLATIGTSAAAIRARFPFLAPQGG